MVPFTSPHTYEIFIHSSLLAQSLPSQVHANSVGRMHFNAHCHFKTSKQTIQVTYGILFSQWRMDYVFAGNVDPLVAEGKAFGRRLQNLGVGAAIIQCDCMRLWLWWLSDTRRLHAR